MFFGRCLNVNLTFSVCWRSLHELHVQCMQVYKKLHCICIIASEPIVSQNLDLHEAPPKQEFHMANFLNPFTLEGGKNYKRQRCRQTPRVNSWRCSVTLFDSLKQTPLQHGHSPSRGWGHWNENSSAVFLNLFFHSFLSFCFFLQWKG